MQMVAEMEHLDRSEVGSGLSLIFPRGQRPAFDRIERALSASDAAGPGAQISYRPDEAEGWVELLASGLTFDLQGLAPAKSATLTEPVYRFGIDRDLAAAEHEAISLAPGAHIAGAGGMLPIVRTMTGLAANLSLLLPMTAVCWEPAAIWMEPSYFARVIVNWLSGGPFPALGLTAIRRRPGGVESVGLAFFSGQEISVEAVAGETPSDTAKLAMRVIDHIAREGPITRLARINSSSGDIVLAEPVPERRVVKVWRGR